MFAGKIGRLSLTRQKEEGFWIESPAGDRIHVRLEKIQGKRARISVLAPKEYRILRDEVCVRGDVAKVAADGFLPLDGQ